MNRVETVLTELRKEIAEKRNWAFAEGTSPFGKVTDYQRRMLAMVSAYDVCLILIDKKFNKGEILKGGEQGDDSRKVVAPEHLKLEDPGPWGVG